MPASVVDSRRLTGPNVVWDRCGVVLDVLFEDDDPNQVVETWRRQLTRMLEAIGWQHEKIAVRQYDNGASLAFSAPMDVLYAATEINDWSWDATKSVLTGGIEPDLDKEAARLQTVIAEERNPPLIDLQTECANRGVPFLPDDDDVSIGMGAYSLCWAAREIPSIDEIDWDTVEAIPVGLVTGTNGKTTTVRLANRMAKAAGYCVGLSSTDWIAVDDDILDRGDWSGPGGARAVLRDKRVTIGLLETARGGLLRRGLAIDSADVALITNIAEDHLGEFGIATVEELADIKWVVTHTLCHEKGAIGRAVLNADDPLLVRRAKNASFDITWFSPDASNEILMAHKVAGGTICTIIDEYFVITDAAGDRQLTAVSDAPITLGGIARHNVANALGAIGFCAALGVPDDAIRTGLRTTTNEDNPGRCNVFNIDGYTVLADFAHNPHGLEALFEIAARYPAKRRIMLLGQAGDRSNDAIRDLAKSAWNIGLDYIVIKEMERYARGREKGEIAALIRAALLDAGADSSAIGYEELEMDAVDRALDAAKPGDLVILLVHEELPAVLDYLRQRANSNSA